MDVSEYASIGFHAYLVKDTSMFIREHGPRSYILHIVAHSTG